MDDNMSIDGTLFLEQLTEKLKYRIEELDVVISEGQKDVESMHEYYWENYTEMDEYGYENYDNQQALLRQVNANQDKLLLKHRFEKMLDSPFFGRVAFIAPMNCCWLGAPPVEMNTAFRRSLFCA